MSVESETGSKSDQSRSSTASADGERTSNKKKNAPKVSKKDKKSSRKDEKDDEEEEEEGDDDDEDEDEDDDDVQYKIQHILACQSMTPTQWQAVCGPMNTRYVQIITYSGSISSYCDTLSDTTNYLISSQQYFF